MRRIGMRAVGMRRVAFFAVLAFCLASGLSLAQTGKPDRQVAVTIDDLPSGMADRLPAADITALTAKLLGTLRDQKIPVVGFVNEKKLYKPGEVDERIKALQMWVDYGFELGNHTFSHSSLNQVGLKAWEDDVIQGETVTKMVMATHKMKLRYFRHPYLDTGRDLLTRRESEAFLTQRGYRIAPITLDGWDWMFAGLYEDAKKRNDTDLQAKIVKEYLSYHDAVFAYDEQLSTKVVGYEPRQILLLHASNLEADHIGELMDVLRKRGYRFITLGDALEDPAYSLPDTYVGEEGTGWIDHWAISLGKIPQGAPKFPEWVIEREQATAHVYGAGVGGAGSNQASSRKIRRPHTPRKLRNRIPAGDRRHEQNLVAFLEGIGRAAEKADVLFVHVNVQEAADLALVIAEMRLEFGKLLVQHGKQVVKVRGGAGDGAYAVGVTAQRSRNLYGDRHGYAPIPATSSVAAITLRTSSTSSVCCRYASNSASFGAIGRSV